MNWLAISRFIGRHESEIEHQLINFIFAMTMVNAFIGVLTILSLAGVSFG